MRGAITQAADAFVGRLPSFALTDVNVPTEFNAGLAAALLVERAHALGMSEDMVTSAVNVGFQRIYEGEQFCESPIEKRMLPWLIFADYGPRVMTVPAILHSPKHQAGMEAGDVTVVPQFAFAKYRMDFGVVARTRSGMCIVCVECDGQATHNPQQDGPRDAYLASWGIPTVRITGKETFSSPASAAGRVSDALRKLLGE
jgi:very-short-patch-repair endonuclease